SGQVQSGSRDRFNRPSSWGPPEVHSPPERSEQLQSEPLYMPADEQRLALHHPATYCGPVVYRGNRPRYSKAHRISIVPDHGSIFSAPLRAWHQTYSRHWPYQNPRTTIDYRPFSTNHRSILGKNQKMICHL